MMSDRLRHLEHPAPKIALTAQRFDVEGAGIVEGGFEVSNIGEGMLEGKISSTSDVLSFAPENFSGGKAWIDYSLNLEGMEGQHKLLAVVTSNGGEKILTFDVKVNPPALDTKDGAKIATLEHFLDYTRHKPVAARQLFTQKEFMFWLFNQGYPSMDIYESFARDPNKERGVDNFLVFNELKSKAVLVAEVKDITHTVGQWEGAITGGFRVRRSVWGYVEGVLSVNPEAKWLKLSKNRLDSTDFDENNVAEVDYIIMAEEAAKTGRGRNVGIVNLNCGRPQNIYIRCNTGGPFDARLEREAYLFEDKGKLFLTNNTGRDLMVDIYCEGYVKFQAKRYFISKSAEIDFDIKFSAIKAASLAMRKLLYVNTEIHIMAVGISGERGAIKKLPLTLWSK